MIEFSEATEDLAERALRARRILPTPEAVRLVAIGIEAVRGKASPAEVVLLAGLAGAFVLAFALFALLMLAGAA